MASKFEVLLTGTLDKKDTDLKIREQIKSIEKNLSLKIDPKVSTAGIKGASSSIGQIGTAAKTSTKHVQNLGDQLGKFAQWQIVR